MQRKLLLPLLFGILVAVLALMAGVASTPGTAQAAASFQDESPLPPPPPNDMFADAQPIDGTPANYAVDGSTATLEDGERQPYAYEWGYPPIINSVWYKLTTDIPRKVMLTAWQDPFSSGTYCLYYAYGASIWDLSEYNCIYFGPDAPASETRWFYPGETWYVRLSMTEGTEPLYTWFHLDVAPAPPPQVQISAYPDAPSKFSNIEFYAYADEPCESLVTWTFGDGSAPVQKSRCDYAYHQYAADGDYLVTAKVVTPDGREGLGVRTVYVRTHDVGIVKFQVPKTAAVGKMKPIVVGLTNKYYPEYATVRLYRVEPYYWGGTNWVQVGEATNQYIPVRAKGSIDFTFNYTFRPEDGKVGSVVFAASVDIANDANAADNSSMALPVKVTTGPKAAEADEGAVQDGFEYVAPPLPLLYLPYIEQ